MRQEVITDARTGEVTTRDIPDADAAAMADLRPAMICSRYQFKVALQLAGHLAAVEIFMNTADPMVQIAWRDASTIRRQSPMVAAIAAKLKTTDDAMDGIFRDAVAVGN